MDEPKAHDLEAAMMEAEEKAWDSLARYKFVMFGYWAAIWVHLNRLSGLRRPNPWRELVSAAREHRGGGDGRQPEPEHSAPMLPGMEEAAEQASREEPGEMREWDGHHCTG